MNNGNITQEYIDSHTYNFSKLNIPNQQDFTNFSADFNNLLSKATGKLSRIDEKYNNSILESHILKLLLKKVESRS